MFIYEKKLQFPVNIKNTNPKLATIILTQYGGPDPRRHGSGRRFRRERRRISPPSPLPGVRGIFR